MLKGALLPIYCASSLHPKGFGKPAVHRETLVDGERITNICSSLVLLFWGLSFIKCWEMVAVSTGEDKMYRSDILLGTAQVERNPSDRVLRSTKWFITYWLLLLLPSLLFVNSGHKPQAENCTVQMGDLECSELKYKWFCATERKKILEKKRRALIKGPRNDHEQQTGWKQIVQLAYAHIPTVCMRGWWRKQSVGWAEVVLPRSDERPNFGRYIKLIVWVSLVTWCSWSVSILCAGDP